MPIRHRILPRRSFNDLVNLFDSDNGSNASTNTPPLRLVASTNGSGWNSNANGNGGWNVSGAGPQNGRSGYGCIGSGGPSGVGGTGGAGGDAGNTGGGGSGNGGGGPGDGHRCSSSSSTNSAPGVQSIFRRLELVGRGAYGAVYRGVHVATGTAVALKVVNLDTPEDDVQDIQHEVAVLSQLKEASKFNVVRYWGCWMKGPELWIVMDFAEGGSIRTLMKSGVIPEKLNAVIVRETLVALSYLHKQGIIHRDIKAANILLTHTGKILLCDFGIAANLQMQNKRSTMIGTPYWMAPEVISKGKLYDQSADIWSLGITIYEMATGNPPLADLDQLAVITLVPKQTPPRLPADGQHSQLMREFVSNCLNEVAIERPTADELSKSKWLKTYAKVPTSALKELLTQYSSWVKSGGMRTSLLGAGLAGLNDPGNRNSFAFDGVESDEGWEFSTLGSQTFEAISEVDEPEASRLPAQLRNHPLARLFDTKNTADTYGGFVPQTFQPYASEALPSEGLLTPTVSQDAPVFSTPVETPTLRQPTPSTTVDSATAKSSANSAGIQPKKALQATSKPTAAANAAAVNGGFSGTGNAPFRFGGGGGASHFRRPTQPSERQRSASIPQPTRCRDESTRSDTDAGPDSRTSTSATSSREDLVSQSGHRSSNSSVNSSSIPTHLRSASRSGHSHKRGKSSVSSFSSTYHSPGSSSYSPAVEQTGWQRQHESKGSISKLMRGYAGRRLDAIKGAMPPFSRSISEHPAPIKKRRPSAGDPDALVLRRQASQPVLDSFGRPRTGSAPETPPPHMKNVHEVGAESSIDRAKPALAASIEGGTNPQSGLSHTRKQHGGSDPTLRSSTDAAGHLARTWRERSTSQASVGGGRSGGVPSGIGAGTAHLVRSQLSMVVAATPPRALKLVRSNLDGIRDAESPMAGRGQHHAGVLGISGDTPGASTSFSTVMPSAAEPAFSALSLGMGTPRGRAEYGGRVRMQGEASESGVALGGAGASASLPQPWTAQSIQSVHAGAMEASLCPLDLVHLMSKDDVNLELAKRVEDVGRWLDLLSHELSSMLE
ncbi:Pkinase-domain-containing protein [Tilletiaria anomala UBC 951]|uniref:non-specific serine/threonine protein kinase n=1 Tax=Tilletiaria anomala (strain ATCC 24038 / CBS 436.72 / UBC 951) TaxID=1037660 RepID=A0A066WEQ0_TILAU|nr:Pkinase-domain-containing protein [Tilletiaria anomala UBC 951]KDN52402.1 Pkinase-domain-containing protein [Tilletiaria anomala UBC 951]